MNKNPRFISTIAFILFLSLLFCACNSDTAAPGVSDSTGPSSAPPRNSIQIGESFEVCPGMETDDPWYLKEGKLVYTITDAYVVNCREDLPPLEGFPETLFRPEYDRGDDPVSLPYPYFVESDGSFSEGHCLVLIDVTVESQNAKRYTRNDLDAEGYGRGFYYDPYFFRMDELYLTDPTQTNQYGSSLINLSAQYFSLRNAHPEYPDAHATYRLEPGETIQYTIGYHLWSELFEAYDAQMNLSTLCVCHSVGDALVELDLAEAE